MASRKSLLRYNGKGNQPLINIASYHLSFARAYIYVQHCAVIKSMRYLNIASIAGVLNASANTTITAHRCFQNIHTLVMKNWLSSIARPNVSAHAEPTIATSRTTVICISIIVCEVASGLFACVFGEEFCRERKWWGGATQMYPFPCTKQCTTHPMIREDDTINFLGKSTSF